MGSVNKADIVLSGAELCKEFLLSFTAVPDKAEVACR